MIKQTLCSVLALSLAGCVFRTSPSIDEARSFTSKPTPTSKITIDCPTCDEDYLEDYFSKGNANSRYQITYDASNTHYEDVDWKFWATFPYNIISALTLFTVVPAYGGNPDLTVSPILHDRQTGKAMALSPIKMSYGSWMGGILTAPFFGPFMYVEDDYVQENSGFINIDEWNIKRDEKASETALKEVALVLYNPTSSDVKTEWKCETYACRLNDIKTHNSASAEDVLYIADNGKSFDDFMYAKGKLAKPLTTAQNCEATLSLIKNQTVSKQTQRYWALIDFFKGNCSNTKGEIGMTKEQLINKKGILSKGYFMNDDTEIISYSSLSYDGESVYTTTYTLDRDIVTGVR